MKIELTEDQVNDIIGMIENWIPNAEFVVQQWGDELVVKPEMHRDWIAYYNREHERALKSKAKLAFRKRILTTLAKAKTQSNS